MITDYLTTEHFRKKFKNNFDLCNFSINIGRNIVMSGNPSTLKSILDEINERSNELVRK